jgi:hypothetical protein
MRLIRTIALGLGILGALIASQLPEFVQQYRQRLGGAIDELTRIVSRFDADAAASQLTREQALSQLSGSTDEVVRRRAEDATENLRRLSSMQDQRQAMAEAGPFARTWAFFGHADDALVTATARDFEPAMPTTSEGLLAALIGYISGWGLARLVGWPWVRYREQRLRGRFSR